LLTGNDLAIDMVRWGSDYLLGLSTFAPEAFAARDAAWAAGDDPRFYALNDVLQYLGHLAFRAPVPGYRHNAAMFLRLRGRIACDATHPDSPQRPASDRDLLVDIARRLDDLGV
jgi:dihydrodipicolinate synthase/N-acetylneuraminate lyase